MFTLRTGTILSLAGMLTGLALTDAQACDDDRFPCPVVSEVVTQEALVAPAERAQLAKPLKKASQSARPAAKAPSKAEENVPSAKGRDAPLAAPTRKVSKATVHKQAAAPIHEKDTGSDAAEASPTVVQTPSDQASKEESRNQALVAAAGTDWPTLPTADSATAASVAIADAAQPAKAVQLSDGNEGKELARPVSDLTGKWSLFSYLLLILSGVLAVASAIWLLPRMRVRALVTRD